MESIVKSIGPEYILLYKSKKLTQLVLFTLKGNGVKAVVTSIFSPEKNKTVLSFIYRCFKQTFIFREVKILLKSSVSRLGTPYICITSSILFWYKVIIVFRSLPYTVSICVPFFYFLILIYQITPVLIYQVHLNQYFSALKSEENESRVKD